MRAAEPQRVGVIIPSFGALEHAANVLSPLLDPQLAQEARPAKVVVVDDAFPGEVDSSVLPEGVEFISRAVNGGFGACVNTGLAAIAQLDWALVLNSDVQLPSEFLPTLMRHCAPWLPAVVGCRNLSTEGHSGYAARYFPTVSQQVIEWLHPLASQRYRRTLHEAVGHNIAADSGSGMIPVDWVSGSMMLLPVRETLELGGFDESYFMYTEEVDLQKRLRQIGVPAVFDADLAIIHEGGQSSGGEERRRAWLTNARDLYARKHLNPWLLRIGLLTATGANLIWNTGRKIAGRDVQPLANARYELELIRSSITFRLDRDKP